ncbi:MAG: acyltransferase family protein [Thermoflexibacteraceae bacterium]|jgi:peptidoglycan/LPS O-acetylase OafA/YrhL
MQQKLAYIDALRGIAILLVIILHTSQYGSPILSFTLNQVVNIGNKGVQLFYVASAFTLFLSFKHKLNKEKSPFKNFFLRRFFRIAPMYYLGIIYYLYQDGWGARYWLGDEPQVTLANIVANFLFIHGLNPYWINSIVHGGWSIAVEMMFYACMPYLFLRIKNINAALNFFVFTLLLRAVLQVILTHTPLIHETYLWNEYLFIYFPNQLPVFTIGIILYFIVIEKENLQDLKGSTLLF